MTSTSENQSAVVSRLCTDALCIYMATAETIISILGLSGNGLVIWITGFKMKKSVNTIFYLSLAVSDFLFCAILPIDVVYAVRQKGGFGSFMRKFSFFFFYLNMFSSIFLLVIINLDRCIVVLFPVWAQNKRSVRKASVMVVLVWIASAAFAGFLAIGQYFEYMVVGEFVFGCVIPLLIITVCSVLITRKLKTNQRMKSTKPFKIMAAVVVVFFICSMPFQILILIISTTEFGKSSDSVSIAFMISHTLVMANSFLNPFLYTFMGKDVKTTCYSVLSKIRSAMEDEGQTV